MVLFKLILFGCYFYTKRSVYLVTLPTNAVNQIYFIMYYYITAYLIS